MAASSTKQRLSSLFSLSRDESVSNLTLSSTSSDHRHSSQDLTAASRSMSPPRNKLYKHRATSSSLERKPLDASLAPLDPPPRLTDHGIERPLSRVGTGSRPSSRIESSGSSREESRSRPQTPVMHQSLSNPDSPFRLSTPDSAKVGKRKSWLAGKLSMGGAEQVVEASGESRAWISGLQEHVPYDLTALVNGARVQDLWNGQGDTFIYLFPEGAGKGPSFKVDSQLFAASKSLLQLSQGTILSQADWSHRPKEPQSLDSTFQNITLQIPDQSYGGPAQPISLYKSSSSYLTQKGPTYYPMEEKHLHVPLQLDGDFSWPNTQPRGDDLELIVLYRNFFAFLSGGALISTPRQISLYSIFVGISSILKRFNFTSADETTFGDVASNSFSRYCDELRLADVRSSREKTIEAIVLGEQMRSWSLYNEGFVHAAGRLDEIKSIKSPKFSHISPVTANRLERATIDIEARLLTVRTKLEDFDFPSMFAGLANSQTSTESRLVRFKEWKLAFTNFRRHVVAHYRHKYGAWPPKAKSKKHDFEESGLNRVLLKALYQDFADLYDMLADRTSMTTRTMDLLPLSDDDMSNDLNESMQHAIRRLESEYDCSSPPVAPPIPFDVPLLPNFMQSFNRSHVNIQVNSARSSKRLKDNEVNELLLGSYNRESLKATPWLQEFVEFERRMGHGKTLDELVDMRVGQWLFVYAVLQCLPMTVVDARDLKFTEGVEYFLCIPSRGGRPWMKEDTSQSRAWYNVANGGGVVNLPADLIDHSVEGIYRRSHCWTIAAKWAHEIAATPTDDYDGRGRSPVLQPTFGSSGPSPRPGPHLSPHVSPNKRDIWPMGSDVRGSHSVNRSSLALGLEMIAAPPDATSRPTNILNPNLTFDSILGTNIPQVKKGKK